MQFTCNYLGGWQAPFHIYLQVLLQKGILCTTTAPILIIVYVLFNCIVRQNTEYQKGTNHGMVRNFVNRTLTDLLLANCKVILTNSVRGIK